MRKPVVVSLALALLLGPLAATAQRTRHTEEVTTVVVEVPVHVVHNGAPVRGLTAEDFEILDGRKQQKIIGFEVIDLETVKEVSTPAAVPLPARRHFLLLFDLSFSEASALVRARQAARALIMEELHPTDLVAVATYSVNVGPKMVLGFTSDRHQVDAAIEDLGLQPVEKFLDPLRLVMVDPSMSGSSGGSGGGGGAAGINRDAMFVEHLRDLTIATDRLQREVQRGYAVAMVTGFKDLGQQLRGVQGRKHVVLLSEGVDSSLLLGTEDADRIRELNEASASGQFWTMGEDERFGNSASLGVMESMLEELRRSDATVHAVDIGGLRADSGSVDRAKGEDSLFMMADGTGGELYRNFNDLGGAMGQMLDRTSVTYVLAFQPGEMPMDGSYHKIRVRLKGGPSGARVIHRPGYYAPVPYEQQSPEARQMEAAQLLLGGDLGGPIPVAALAAAVRGAGELAYVPVLVEIDGPSILASANGKTSVLDLYAYALDSNGQVRDFVSQQMGLDLERLEPVLRQRGVKFFGHLDLPPGQYTLRVLLREVATGRSTVQETALLVPRLGDQQSALLPPLFPHAMGEWLIVREQLRAGKATDAPYPFQLDGQPFLPSSRPVISAGGQAELVLMAYNTQIEGRRLEGRVLDGAGTEVGVATLQKVGTAPGWQPGLEQVKARFQAARLQPGEYRLEVSLVDPGSGDTISSSIPFLVGS